MIDPRLLEILACPLTNERPPLRLQGDYLVCDACAKAFPIVNGIPHLLPENAIPLEKLEDPTNAGHRPEDPDPTRTEH